MNKDEIVGFKIIDNNTYEFRNIDIPKAKEMIREITNLKVGCNGQLIGGSGRLDRYDDCDSIHTTSSTYTLLNSIVKNGKVIGYRICSTEEVKDIMSYNIGLLYENGRLTNCRKNRGGISLIKGNIIQLDYDKR